MTVYDRWHLAHPPDGARKCGPHRKAPSAVHGTGLRWQVRGKDADGRPIPKESFEHEQDARDRDAELRTAVRSGTLIDEKGGKITFRDYAEKWRKTQTHDHSSAELLETRLRVHCYEAADTPGRTPSNRTAIGGHQMAVLGRRVSLMRAWVADIRLSPNTARQLISTVESIFDAAMDDLIVSRNPLKAKSVGKPQRVRTDVLVWAPEQVEAVVQKLPEEMRPMGYLGAVTGARQGELLGLAKDDIDFLRRTVRYEVQVAYVGRRLVFRPLKNHRRKPSRTVPIAAPVIPVLSEHLRLRPAVPVTLPWCEKGSRLDGKPVTRELVFTDPAGRAWFRHSVNRQWRRAWKAAGAADQGAANGMHILRHTAASRWLSKGLNPAKVAAYLGDTVAMVIATYAHWLPDDDNLGRAIMDEYLAPGSAPSEKQKRPENAMGSA